MKIKTARTCLIFMLRMMGLFSVLAVTAIFMPHSWMDWCHDHLNMGNLPDLPIIRYLSRSLSGFYLFFGAIVLFVSRDIDRYFDFLTFWAKCGFLYAFVTLYIDITSKLPIWWILAETGFLFLFFTAVTLLLRRVKP